MTKQRCAQWDGFCGPVYVAGLCRRHYDKGHRKSPEYRGPVDGRKVLRLRRRSSDFNHRRVTRKQVARAVGVSEDTLLRWEKGDAPVPLEYVAPLAQALGVTPADLAFDSSFTNQGATP